MRTPVWPQTHALTLWGGKNCNSAEISESHNLPDWTYCNSRLICRINCATFANHCKTIFICRKIIVIFPLVLSSGESKFSHPPSKQTLPENHLPKWSVQCSLTDLNSNLYHECHKHLIFPFSRWGTCVERHCPWPTCEIPGNPWALCTVNGDYRAYLTADSAGQGQHQETSVWGSTLLCEAVHKVLYESQ